MNLALQKVREGRPNDLQHYLSVFNTDLLLTQALSYTADNLTEYIGYAQPGSSKAQPVWLIKKLTYSGVFVVDIQFAGGRATFENIWNDRASLSYS